MKKFVALMLALLMCVSLCACGPSEQDKLAEQLAGEWRGVYDGDTYVFLADGTGTHDNISVTWVIDEELSIKIGEGVGVSASKKLNLTTRGEMEVFYVEGVNNFYVRSENYETVSKQVMEESVSILESCEFWKSTKGVNYISFGANETRDGGGGWFLMPGDTFGMNWEMLDANTVKCSVNYNGGYTITLEIVNANGEYSLVNPGNWVVMYVPKT